MLYPNAVPPEAPCRICLAPIPRGELCHDCFGMLEPENLGPYESGSLTIYGYLVTPKPDLKLVKGGR